MSVFVWAVVGALILVNAIYVAAEFAAVGVRRSQIRLLAQEGRPLAKGLSPILEDARRLDRYIAACQIGITLSSLILGAFGQATLASDLAPLFQSWGGFQETAAHSTAAMIVLVALTALQVVFGELLPKSLALQYPVQLALYTFPPLRWSLVLYTWFIAILNGSGIFLLRLLGVSSARHRHVHSPEEIDMLIVESRDGGLLDLNEQQRLHQALQLSRRTARQLMIPRRFVAAIEVNTPVDEILQMAIESPYSSLPVYEGALDNIIGIVHSKDLAVHYVKHGRPALVRQVIRPVPSVPSSVTADRLLALMREQRCRKVVVLNEFGGMEGIVTLEDVLTELIGVVADEFKGGQPQPERLADGRVRLPGMLHLDAAATWIGATWQSEAITIGGHIISTLERIPQAGEHVTVEGLMVEIERMEGRAIASALVTPKLAEPPNAWLHGAEQPASNSDVAPHG